MSPEELVDVELVEPPEFDPVELPAVSPAVVIPVVVGAWPAVPPQAEPRSTTARAFCGKLTTARLSGHSLRAKSAGSGELGRFPGPVQASTSRLAREAEPQEIRCPKKYRAPST